MSRDYYTTGPRVPPLTNVEHMSLDRLTVMIREGIRDHQAAQVSAQPDAYAVAHRGTHRLGPSVPGARLQFERKP